MLNVKTGEINPLSTDLKGYKNYLESLGLSERQVGFLQLAPRKLFKLYGTYSGLELLKQHNFRSIFLETINHNYRKGTLKKYASGITHYRNYLLVEKILEGVPSLYPARNKYDSVRLYYQENKTYFYEELEVKFHQHLTDEKKHCEVEIRKKTATYQRFAAYLIESGFKSLSDLKGENILEFGSLKTTYRTDWNKLRSFLKFAYREGYVPENFSATVIPNKKYRHRRKKYISKTEIDTLLESLPCSTGRDMRTYAMFLLMARLGLRPSETVRVELNDIDWVNGKILVRGKNRRIDWMPLPSEVADAIILYLKRAKRGNSELLFVQERPPYNPITNTYGLTEALKLAYDRTGIQSPTENVRLNVFRLSLIHI